MPRYTVENAMGAAVYLNGVEVRDCSEADTDEGYVIVAKRNAEGDLYAIGDEIATEKLTGIVTVELL